MKRTGLESIGHQSRTRKRQMPDLTMVRVHSQILLGLFLYS